jgi:hypothetical protein
MWRKNVKICDKKQTNKQTNKQTSEQTNKRTERMFKKKRLQAKTNLIKVGIRGDDCLGALTLSFCEVEVQEGRRVQVAHAACCNHVPHRDPYRRSEQADKNQCCKHYFGSDMMWLLYL